MDYATAVHKFFNTEKRFQAACKKIILIDQKLSRLDVQMKRAEDDANRSCYFSRKLQLSTLEGVRFAYFQYAKKKAEEMDELRNICLSSDESSEEEPMEED